MNTRLFAVLCQEMGSEHKWLLLRTEIRWVSQGKVLLRLFEMRWSTPIPTGYAECLTDPKWLSNLAYFAELIDRINGLNMTLQGPNTNIVISPTKLRGLKKLTHWKVPPEGSVEIVHWTPWAWGKWTAPGWCHKGKDRSSPPRTYWTFLEVLSRGDAQKRLDPTTIHCHHRCQLPVIGATGLPLGPVQWQDPAGGIWAVNRRRIPGIIWNRVG